MFHLLMLPLSLLRDGVLLSLELNNQIIQMTGQQAPTFPPSSPPQCQHHRQGLLYFDFCINTCNLSSDSHSFRAGSLPTESSLLHPCPHQTCSCHCTYTKKRVLGTRKIAKQFEGNITLAEDPSLVSRTKDRQLTASSNSSCRGTQYLWPLLGTCIHRHKTSSMVVSSLILQLCNSNMIQYIQRL